MICRGAKGGVKALRPRSGAAERGLDSAPASAILCYPGNVIRLLVGPLRRADSRALRGVLAPGLASSSGPDRRVH